MDKPDYDFWDRQPEYNLAEAAALCCDIEPQRWTQENPEPTKVVSMGRRLLKEVEFRDTSYTRHTENWITRETDSRRVKGERYFQREKLRQWAEGTGQRQAMPFLFPEDRARGSTEEPHTRVDTKGALLYIIGLLAHALVKRSGKDLGTPEAPNQAGIARVVLKQAEDLGASREGLSPSHLSERLKEAFEEVRHRI